MKETVTEKMSEKRNERDSNMSKPLYKPARRSSDSHVFDKDVFPLVCVASNQICRR